MSTTSLLPTDMWAFRFSVRNGEHKISVASIQWDGRDLVLSRPLILRWNSLLSEVRECVDTITIQAYQKTEDPPLPPDMPVAAVAWVVSFDRIEDMGFDRLISADTDLLYEAIRLVGARVTTAGTRGTTN